MHHCWYEGVLTGTVSPFSLFPCNHYFTIYPFSAHKFDLDLGGSLHLRSIYGALKHWPLNVLNGFTRPLNSVSNLALSCNHCLLKLLCFIGHHHPRCRNQFTNIHLSQTIAVGLLRCSLVSHWQNVSFTIGSSPLPTSPASPANLRMLVVYTSPVHFIYLSFLCATNGPSKNAFFSACSILCTSFWLSSLNCRQRTKVSPSRNKGIKLAKSGIFCNLTTNYVSLSIKRLHHISV